MSGGETRLLVCAPNDGRNRIEIPGTTVATADCGHEILLAPSGRKLIHEHEGMIVYCGNCAEAMIAGHVLAGGPTRLAPLNLEQTLELDAAERAS